MHVSIDANTVIVPRQEPWLLLGLIDGDHVHIVGSAAPNTHVLASLPYGINVIGAYGDDNEQLLPLIREYCHDQGLIGQSVENLFMVVNGEFEPVDIVQKCPFNHIRMRISSIVTLQSWSSEEAMRWREQAASLTLHVEPPGIVMTGTALDKPISSWASKDILHKCVLVQPASHQPCVGALCVSQPSPVPVTLSADVIVWLNDDINGIDAIKHVIDAIYAQILRVGRDEIEVQARHFAPHMLSHTITMIKDSESERMRLHEGFGLPIRPLLRANQSIDHTPIRTHQSPLVNVHLGVDVGQSTVHLVDGLYEYYHYLQQGERDKGWGCAYRSLQTLCSWLHLQGYDGKDVPTISEIQESLVKIGDKDPAFVGSEQWIGAMECSYVLDTLYGVECRILNVSSGHDLADHGRALAHHFDVNGTPIMIGGGVLAYTLIGVDFDTATGAVRFLILDPHYIGPESVSAIQGKGWIGWKSVDLFVKGAFYNLCMPQRPKDVV